MREAPQLVDFDWLVSASWNRLHYADLDADQRIELEDECVLEGPLRLACGRTAKWVSIPGVFTRMGADRCQGCCRATGLPQGVGSPKNDEACRAILGMPDLETQRAISRAAFDAYFKANPHTPPTPPTQETS